MWSLEILSQSWINPASFVQVHAVTKCWKYMQNTSWQTSKQYGHSFTQPVWHHASIVLRCRSGSHLPLSPFSVVICASILVKCSWVTNVQLKQIFYLIRCKLLALLRRSCRWRYVISPPVISIISRLMPDGIRCWVIGWTAPAATPMSQQYITLYTFN